jgi:bla regulator protein blaR1
MNYRPWTMDYRLWTLTNTGMENALYNISQVLGITIIHSLWQGLVIYFILRMVLMFSAQLPASKKYLVAVTSLLAITGWFIYTLINEIHIYNWLAVKPATTTAIPLLLQLPAGVHKLDDEAVRYYYNIEGYLPYISIVYIAGLLFNTTRLFLSRRKINFIRQTMSIDIALQYQVTKFAGMLNIAKGVKVGLSRLVDVPCMVGFFKPVVLLPFTLATYLSPEEIEAILLHELAHIKRNDYLINLLQQVISILLFFNPCTQLINRIINEERENCCDDMVIKTTSNPLTYAKALFKLEETRRNDVHLAMSAIGKKYHLFNRIERIMKTKKQLPSLRPALLAMLILTIGIGCVALLSPQIAQGKISIKAISPALSNLLSDTTHKKPAKKQQHLSKTHLHKKSSNGEAAYNSTEADEKLQALSADVEKNSEELSKFYGSDAFKATSEQMEQLGKEMQEFYNNPEIKRLQEEMGQASANFSKNWGDNDKLTTLSSKMGETGNKIGAYFNSPEFKKMNFELEKKYGLPHERHYYNDNDPKDENYRKYEAELESKLPPEIKQLTARLKTMGEQMSARYETPEFKEQNKRLQQLGDSLKKLYENPQLKEQQEKMEKLSRQMSGYQNNPELKRANELLQKAVAKMNAYMNSPAYRHYLEALKNMNFNYNYNFNDDNEKPEKAEKPERPEKPEKPEKPEEEKPETRIKMNTREFKEHIANINSAGFMKSMANINSLAFRKSMANINSPEFRKSMANINSPEFKKDMVNLLDQPKVSADNDGD